jgi:hypothetical protein
VMSYGGGTTVVSVSGKSKPTANQPKKTCGCGGDCCKQAKPYPVQENGEPDFVQMTTAQKIIYQKERRKEIWG